MKKIISILALSLIVLLLVGCSDKTPAANASVEDIYTSIKDQIGQDLRDTGFGDADFEAEELPGYTLIDLKGPDAEYALPELNKDDVEAGFVIKASMMLNSDQIVIIKAAPGKIEPVKEALEAELASQLALWESYLADQAEKVQNAIITVQGDFLVYITYPDAEAIEAIFNDAF